ncbi:unnamed protein product [Knipowitschia caucasica]
MIPSLSTQKNYNAQFTHRLEFTSRDYHVDTRHRLPLPGSKHRASASCLLTTEQTPVCTYRTPALHTQSRMSFVTSSLDKLQ